MNAATIREIFESDERKGPLKKEASEETIKILYSYED
jgi:hypothetical protein